MTAWLTPGVVAGLCLLALPVLLAVAWVVRLTWNRTRSDDWQDDGNRRPTRWGK
jgi:hypothetical protein